VRTCSSTDLYHRVTDRPLICLFYLHYFFFFNLEYKWGFGKKQFKMWQIDFKRNNKIAHQIGAVTIRSNAVAIVVIFSCMTYSTHWSWPTLSILFDLPQIIPLTGVWAKSPSTTNISIEVRTSIIYLLVVIHKVTVWKVYKLFWINMCILHWRHKLQNKFKEKILNN
jgi:hypothetical protein